LPEDSTSISDRAPVRLNAFIARSGIASRREADRLIQQGRVSVNGEVVQAMGRRIDPAADRVEVDGRPVRADIVPTYVMLHKPPGYLVTMKDPRQRPTITRLLPVRSLGVVPVGRLDFESEGLLLLTNDGELGHRLMHPRYEVRKKYRVRVRGQPPEAALRRLAHGIVLDGRRTAPARIARLGGGAGASEMEVEIHEGRKREIRRMFAAVGHPVRSLKRIHFGNLSLGALRPGTWRHLKPKEVAGLKALVNLGGRENGPGRGARKKGAA
jgi:pseudouridine synthase